MPGMFGRNRQLMAPDGIVMPHMIFGVVLGQAYVAAL